MTAMNMHLLLISSALAVHLVMIAFFTLYALKFFNVFQFYSYNALYEAPSVIR